MIGQIISHYRILERLGAGGMGEVFKAEDLRLHRPVALKMLVASCQSEIAKQRLLCEARTASALNHPNIATIYEIEDADSEGERRSFIAMEYVAGCTLAEFVSKRKPSIAEALDIVLQIADALAEAHDRGIVHRDVKPSNVLINEQGRVKVVDFGLAKFHPAQPKVNRTLSEYGTEIINTAPGLVIGTLAYLSPEQALGQGLDPRTDIFSLGVLLYELLAGRLPFAGDNLLAVASRLLHAEPPALSSFNPEVTPELERIVRQMLEKDREQRYQSMREVHLALDAVRRQMMCLSSLPQTQSGHLVQSSPGHTTETGRRSHRARGSRSFAVKKFINISGQADDDWLGAGIAETVTADLKTVAGLSVIERQRTDGRGRSLDVGHDGGFDERLASCAEGETEAGFIVAGGYQRIGERLRITARLVEAETGEVIKVAKVDGRMDELFDLQDKIVFELSRGLDLNLLGAGQEMIKQDGQQAARTGAVFTSNALSLRAASQGDRLFNRAPALDLSNSQYANRALFQANEYVC
jgi:non-specific serine/threonine protein kinase